MKTYKCGNKYCPNNNTVNEDVAVKIGSRYYCPKCAKEVNGKKEIRELYKKTIDSHPNMSQLNLAIKKLVNEYKCDIDLILYAIKYVNENKIPITNPFGLTWVVKDDKMIKRYKKEIVTKKANKVREGMNNKDVNTTNDNTFKYKPTRPKWMTDIR